MTGIEVLGVATAAVWVFGLGILAPPASAWLAGATVAVVVNRTGRHGRHRQE